MVMQQGVRMNASTPRPARSDAWGDGGMLMSQAVYGGIILHDQRSRCETKEMSFRCSPTQVLMSGGGVACGR